MICAPSAWSSSGEQHFTVAWVPTGMNTGVSIAPCGVATRPRRALDVASRERRVKGLDGGEITRAFNERAPAVAQPRMRIQASYREWTHEELPRQILNWRHYFSTQPHMEPSPRNCAAE